MEHAALEESNRGQGPQEAPLGQSHEQDQEQGIGCSQSGHLRGQQNAPNPEDVQQREGKAQGGEVLRR